MKQQYSKRFDPGVGTFYYINKRNGDCLWTKPVNLGSDDLPDPADEWQAMEDEYKNKFYLHPLTGRTSWMSLDEACTKMQRLWRKRCAQEYRIDDMSVVIRALKFEREAERKFVEHPDRLSSIINYALLLVSGVALFRLSWRCCLTITTTAAVALVR